MLLQPRARRRFGVLDADTRLPANTLPLEADARQGALVLLSFRARTVMAMVPANHCGCVPNESMCAPASGLLSPVDAACWNHLQIQTCPRVILCDPESTRPQGSTGHVLGRSGRAIWERPSGPFACSLGP